ncbi:hypothetical protein EYF80_063306 [Liparis tanakae]|uniref:Uncharacterized protein n=1 Tax=Liparis tanakae TaxID=230148 RepID=A0A4Z2ECR4_9TELE|nr:hypothetical protein EYF80_063306 [Liparis tanakae]
MKELSGRSSNRTEGGAPTEQRAELQPNRGRSSNRTEGGAPTEQWVEFNPNRGRSSNRTEGGAPTEQKASGRSSNRRLLFFVKGPSVFSVFLLRGHEGS